MSEPAQSPAEQAPSLRTALDASSAVSPAAAQQFAAQVQAWANSAATMKATAQAGGFAVDPESGQAYVDAYNFALDTARELRADMANVVLTYQLGTTPGAQKVEPWNLQVAHELQAAFNQLPEIYANARDAYTQAMQNYQHTEQAVAGALRRSTNV